ETLVSPAPTRAHWEKALEIATAGLLTRLEERKIHVRRPDRAKDVRVREGYDPAYGARPLKRTVQGRVRDPLALRVLEGDFVEGDTVVVDVAGGETLRFEKRQTITA